MRKEQVRNSFLLLLTATIWGVAFVAQSVGMDYVEPFTFNGIRSIMGGIVLIPVIWFMNRGKEKETDAQKIREERKTLIIGGICCGLCLCAATNIQQIGIQYTTVGKAGFITACYIVIVPILGMFLKKKCSPLIWLSVAMAVVGLYLLCITDSFTIGKGDVMVMICAVIFSVHILVIDYFAPRTDCVKMSCIQFLVCGLVSAVPMFLFETPKLSNILAAWQPLAYAGILSCGVAYTLQIVGQKNMNPTVASLILSMESCTSVIAGWLILHQKLSLKEIIGCLIMFGAIILAQLPQKKTE